MRCGKKRSDQYFALPCYWMNARDIAATPGVFKVEGKHKGIIAKKGFRAPKFGVFCPREDPDACYEVAAGTSLMKPGTFTPEKTEAMVETAIGDVTPAAGMFCPLPGFKVCRNVVRGDWTKEAGDFETSGGTAEQAVQPRYVFQADGTFCPEGAHKAGSGVKRPAPTAADIAKAVADAAYAAGGSPSQVARAAGDAARAAGLHHGMSFEEARDAQAAATYMAGGTAQMIHKEAVLPSKKEDEAAAKDSARVAKNAGLLIERHAAAAEMRALGLVGDDPDGAAHPERKPAAALADQLAAVAAEAASADVRVTRTPKSTAQVVTEAAKAAKVAAQDAARLGKEPQEVATAAANAAQAVADGQNPPELQRAKKLTAHQAGKKAADLARKARELRDRQAAKPPSLLPEGKLRNQATIKAVARTEETVKAATAQLDAGAPGSQVVESAITGKFPTAEKPTIEDTGLEATS
eukprot:TRINITY_DN23414_c1_g2_i6.p1 TRINITY_DN23414_c1_g2~~TRINITY_DN23414_c1_g2_i6.p1  ORF type:complete len:465 (-),score=135.97 TRINITY_DN23414_c1_g2_i6:279-1673(-)